MLPPEEAAPVEQAGPEHDAEVELALRRGRGRARREEADRQDAERHAAALGGPVPGDAVVHLTVSLRRIGPTG